MVVRLVALFAFSLAAPLCAGCSCAHMAAERRLSLDRSVRRAELEAAVRAAPAVYDVTARGGDRRHALFFFPYRADRFYGFRWDDRLFGGVVHKEGTRTLRLKAYLYNRPTDGQTQARARRLLDELKDHLLDSLSTPRSRDDTGLERVTVRGDRFVLDPSGRPFVAWGHNYCTPYENKLLEDIWETRWGDVEGDFREMKALGANVVRIHLQVAKFMDAPDRMNDAALAQLDKLLAMAERERLYLDVTGLATYRPSDTPVWYESLDEERRWAAQAFFWGEIARRCAKSDAVFCYDLMNEPVSPGGKRDKYSSGHLLGGFDFLQAIALDQRDRPRDVIAARWIATMRNAIRAHDPHRLITVGLLPWDPKWRHLSGFVPETVAPELDFLSVHIYPQQGKPDDAVEVLKKFAVGPPVVVEEIFPLACDAATLRQFIDRARPISSGWIGHYFGQSLEELNQLKSDGKASVGHELTRQWLELFQEVARSSP